MYETGTAVGVRAFHVMPGMPPSRGERHSHDYRLDMVVRREEFDERGMVVDLDVLDKALQDPSPGSTGPIWVRLLRDGEAVSVEVFAGWVYDQLTAALARLPGATLAVRVWENRSRSAATPRRGGPRP